MKKIKKLQIIVLLLIISLFTMHFFYTKSSSNSADSKIASPFIKKVLLNTNSCNNSLILINNDMNIGKFRKNIIDNGILMCKKSYSEISLLKTPEELPSRKQILLQQLKNDYKEYCYLISVGFEHLKKSSYDFNSEEYDQFTKYHKLSINKLLVGSDKLAKFEEKKPIYLKNLNNIK